MAYIVNKNDRLNVYVEDLTHDGSGVAKVDGYPLFIPGALPGEEAEVQVIKPMKKYGFAKLINVTKPSPDRVEPPCHVFWDCGDVSFSTCLTRHSSFRNKKQYAM